MPGPIRRSLRTILTAAALTLAACGADHAAERTSSAEPPPASAPNAGAATAPAAAPAPAQPDIPPQHLARASLRVLGMT